MNFAWHRNTIANKREALKRLKIKDHIELPTRSMQKFPYTISVSLQNAKSD